MKPFFLFANHLDLAHHFWRFAVRPGDTVLDATCGNGKDSSFLARLALTKKSGSLYCVDVQDAALKHTQSRLQEQLSTCLLERVHFFCQSHACFPSCIKPRSVQLIVYNLGYLPGSDKEVTTSIESTLASLEQARFLIRAGGCMSITAYPGHPEGEKELRALLDTLPLWDKAEWSISRHTWTHRSEKAPSLFLIQSRAHPAFV